MARCWTSSGQIWDNRGAHHDHWRLISGRRACKSSATFGVPCSACNNRAPSPRVATCSPRVRGREGKLGDTHSSRCVGLWFLLSRHFARADFGRWCLPPQARVRLARACFLISCLALFYVGAGRRRRGMMLARMIVNPVAQLGGSARCALFSGLRRKSLAKGRYGGRRAFRRNPQSGSDLTGFEGRLAIEAV